MLPNGKAAFTEYVSSNIPAGNIPEEIPELVAEGPYVAMARIALYPEADGSLSEAEGSGAIYTSTHFDMFRLEAGSIIEHWDTASKGELPAIMQGIPMQ